MKINSLLLTLGFAICMLLAGCNQTKPEAAPTESKAQRNSLPTLPIAYQNELLDKVTTVDIIFYHLPISLSQEEKYSVNKTIGFITREAVEVDPNCQALGRASFLENGETLLDADIFFSAGCTYFITIEDGKPKYGGQMSQIGINFYKNIIQNFQKSGQDQ